MYIHIRNFCCETSSKAVKLNRKKELGKILLSAPLRSRPFRIFLYILITYYSRFNEQQTKLQLTNPNCTRFEGRTSNSKPLISKCKYACEMVYLIITDDRVMTIYHYSWRRDNATRGTYNELICIELPQTGIRSRAAFSLRVIQ
jgi:hypothetical protein